MSRKQWLLLVVHPISMTSLTKLSPLMTINIKSEWKKRKPELLQTLPRSIDHRVMDLPKTKAPLPLPPLPLLRPPKNRKVLDLRSLKKKSNVVEKATSADTAVNRITKSSTVPSNPKDSWLLP